MDLIERIARVIAGYRLSANADGNVESAADVVGAEWSNYCDEAAAILKTLREPSPTMEESGMGAEWQVLVEREIAYVDGNGQ